MIGPAFWSTGIVIERDAQGKWRGYFDLSDHGFCTPGTCEGRIQSRYAETDVEVLIDALVDSATKMGVVWMEQARCPTIYYEQDGEAQDGSLRANAPADWLEICTSQAERLGWTPSYTSTRA